MAFGVGNRAYCGIGFETAWGTKNTDLTDSASNSPWIDVNSETITDDERVLRSSSLTGVAPLTNKVAQGPRGITGDVVWTPNMNCETIHRLFYAAMGSYRSVGSSDAEYRPAVSLPGVTIESHLDRTAIRYYGGALTQLRGTVSPDSFFDITSSWIFKDFDVIAYVDYATRTFDGADKDTLVRSDFLTTATWEVSGADLYDMGVKVREFEFFYDNRLNPDRRVLGSRLIKEPDRTDRLNTGGRAVIEFEDITLFYDYYSANQGEMRFTFSTGDITGSAGTPYMLDLLWPRAEIRSGTPTVNSFGLITVEVEWEGLQGVTGVAVDDAAFVATITSDAATVSAATDSFPA